MPESPSANASLNTNALVTQLTTGPSLREVAAAALQPQLRALYPQLDIDPNLAVVVSPAWQLANGHLPTGPSRLETLSGSLARHALASTQASYLDGEHYLTYRSNERPDIHLPVRIDAIGRLINELAPMLSFAFQEQQLDYWNSTGGPDGPRWKVLANALRNVWDLEGSNWNDDERALARNVFLYPDYALRLPNDKYGTRTYLVDLDVEQGGQIEHLNLTSIAVLIGTLAQRTIILTYSLGSGHEHFDSLQTLGDALTGHAINPQGLPLHWRLFEPEGDFFEHLACTLISLQIDAIAEVAHVDKDTPATVAPTERTLLLDAGRLPSVDQARVQGIRDAFPGWLEHAPLTDLTLYNRYVLDLAQLNGRQAFRTYDEGIPPLSDYTRQALQAQMIKDHPQAVTVDLEKILITVTSQRVVGLFTAPGLVETVSLSLIDLALQNLIALPLGNKTVSYEDASAVPEWMTVNYLEGLVTTVDIGQQYPALINQTLLNDPAESARRQALYIEQLRVQLPLMALQQKIRNQFGIDELGYRYICAAMSSAPDQQRAEGQRIVIRPLAFIPTLRLSRRADKVANMFVIGPLDAQAGPCLLYQPLSDQPLIQFASRNNLIYAIKQDTPLRQAVLAWLPDESRFGYAQFVFPGTLASPWVLSKLLIQPLEALVMSGPMTLGDEVLSGDALTELFTSNVNALVTLADRQSVSNAEARWESFKRTGWLVFNAALPFLGKTVGIAAWIGQIMDDLEQVTIAQEEGNSQGQSTAVTDILLSLGMALALHIASRHAPTVKRPGGHDTVREEVTPKLIPSVTQSATIESAHLPLGHESSLHTLGALTRKPLSLGKTLESFSVDKPERLGSQNSQPGPYQHLYPLAEHWYANVGQRWFQVLVDDNDCVLIVDPKQPTRLGPVLINNRLGQWFVDTRLRLRGAGLRSRLKKGRKLRPPKIAELRQQLDDFDDQKLQKAVEVQTAYTAIQSEPGSSSQANRTEFISKALKLREEYDVPISHLKALNILDTVPNYPRKMASYLKQQILLARSVLDTGVGDFQNALDSVGPHLKNTSPPVAEHRRLYDMAGQMLQHLEYLQSRLDDLQGLGAEALEVIEDARRQMPATNPVDLKAFRISLARYLCVQAPAEAAQSAARTALNRICEAADLTIVSLREIQERSSTPPPLDQRIDVLDNLVDQFAVINQDCLDLPNEFSGQIDIELLNNARKQIDEFAQQATRQLVLALRDRKAEQTKSRPTQTEQAPRRKIIKTRSRGVVVGEARLNDPSLVDVKAPLTHQVVATFHEKTPGVWVRHVLEHSPTPAAHALGLKASMKNAQALLDDADRFIERTRGLAGETRRLPVEIEEKVLRQAETLEAAANAVEHAANATNETDDTASRDVRRKVEDAVRKLDREGRRIKLDMLKKRPPTAAHVELLYIDKEITIQTLGARRRLKGPRKDYLQEYEIRDKKDNEVLWYAHFHYAVPDAASEHYTAAHLKTPEQRRLGGAFEQPGATPEQAGIAIYRSEIGPHLARLLFLNPQPTEPKPGPSGSAQG